MPFESREKKEKVRMLRQNLPELGAPVYPINDKMIAAFLEKLVAVAHHDEYYIITDLRGDADGVPQIIWAEGIQRCLGYADSEVKDVFFVLDLIHEQYRDQFMRFAGAAYRILANFNGRLDSLQQRYIINLPIRKANGKYVWVKQMSMPLRMDKNGRLVHQMNCYTIMSGFKGVKLPFAPRIYDERSKRRKDLEEDLFLQVIDILARSLTPAEILIFKTYLELQRELMEFGNLRGADQTVIRRRHIADALGLDDSTIRSQIKSINDKAQHFFSVVFTDFHEMFAAMGKFGVEKYFQTNNA